MSDQAMTREPVTVRPLAPSPWGPLALGLAPVLVLVATLVQTAPAAHDTESELASIAAAPLTYQLSAAIGFCAMVLYVPGLIALAAPVRAGRPRLGAVGLMLSMTGLLGLVSLMGSGPVSLAMAESADRVAMIRVTDAYESAPLSIAWMLLMLFGFTLGPVVLGVGLWRCGGTPIVPILLVAGVVVQMLDAGRWPLALGYALTAAGLVIAAATMWLRSSAAPLPPSGVE